MNDPMTTDQLDQLRAAIAEAEQERDADEAYWTEEAIGQDTEEAEQSGYLIGYAAGLTAALKLLTGAQS